jgi:hypothetical protein
MEYRLIEPGRTYLCVYGDARYRVTVRDKSGSLVLVRLDLKLEDGEAVGLPEAAEIGAEIWVAPDSIEPETRTT